MSKTVLKDRILHYDGDITSTSMTYLYNKLLSGQPIDHVHVSEITKEIEFYNSANVNKLTVKNSNSPLSLRWNIPDNYKNLAVRKYVLLCLERELAGGNFTATQVNDRIERVNLELHLWESHGLNELLSVLIYIIDELEDNGVVWGTGRGSSCCCYILYLIGLHDVDSVRYGLHLSEFFRD